MIDFLIVEFKSLLFLNFRIQYGGGEYYLVKISSESGHRITLGRKHKEVWNTSAAVSVDSRALRHLLQQQPSSESCVRDCLSAMC